MAYVYLINPLVFVSLLSKKRGGKFCFAARQMALFKPDFEKYENNKMLIAPLCFTTRGVRPSKAILIHPSIDLNLTALLDTCLVK